MTNQPIPSIASLYERFSRREPVPDWIIGVKTTGIYCRSGCPARTPKVENTTFFESAAAARSAGYRACKRCRPDEIGPLSAAERTLVEQAVRQMEQGEGRTTAGVARSLGLSAAALDRLIRRAMGVSLAVYGEAHRFRQLRQVLERAPSVTDAIYEAGFNGPRRVYEKGNDMLGMTPGRFRQGGKGERIGFAVVPTVLGFLGVAATRKGVALIHIRPDAEKVRAEIERVFHQAELVEDGDVLEEALSIAKAVNERSHMPDLPLDIQASAFEAQVWQALLAIPRGETRSYGDIARSIGNPSASRAVGRACGANPAALLIPCHRAIGSDGKLTGFAFGLPAKVRLLQDEGALLQMGHGTLV